MQRSSKKEVRFITNIPFPVNFSYSCIAMASYVTKRLFLTLRCRRLLASKMEGMPMSSARR